MGSFQVLAGTLQKVVKKHAFFRVAAVPQNAVVNFHHFEVIFEHPF